ncbi:hypothetical protein LVY72_09360 [Arthrobacter sp. I2-34]|uniref:Uncharacterized protein n=1 Tax=Arthrobacter hankyongi TaxID=2904801 RepID=A0ABS9L625_9MICC|nr:hypothetical protein [Arthrobacter hankyongi]MCG2622125.1 hypothetical protein [Arthrobacter hankyongi]
MHTDQQTAPIVDLSLLHRGDEVEARRGGTAYYRGRVHATAPGLGMLWIREQGRNARRAVPADEYSIHRLGRARR